MQQRDPLQEVIPIWLGFVHNLFLICCFRRIIRRPLREVGIGVSPSVGHLSADAIKAFRFE